MQDLATRQYAIAINSMQTGKLPRDDPRWGTFNRSFQNKELTVMDFANEVYTGHAYTSWHKGERRSENWDRSQFVAVDMDTEDARSSLKVLRQDELVRMFASVLHTTPSHVPQAPRARIVFLFDRPLDSPQAWSTASKFMTQMFNGDNRATDCSRFFFGNDHAEMEVYDHILPVQKLRLMYKRWRNGGGKFPDEISKPQQSVPVPTASPAPRRGDEKHALSEAEYILARIGPWDMDYTDWLRVLGALHAEFGMAALPLAERWAQGKRGEIQRMFNTFERNQGSGRNKARWGTLHRIASEHGALPQRIAFAQ